MRFSVTALTAFLSLTEAAVIYKQATSYVVVTASPTDNYVTVTADAQVKTIDSTVEETITLYRATTKPVTLYTGTIYTILSTEEPNKVQPLPTSAKLTSPTVSKSLSPSQYTAPVEITPTAPVVPTVALSVAQPSVTPSSSFASRTFTTVRITSSLAESSSQPQPSSQSQSETCYVSQSQPSAEPQTSSVPQTSSELQSSSESLTTSESQPLTTSECQTLTTSESKSQSSSVPQTSELQSSSEPMTTSESQSLTTSESQSQSQSSSESLTTSESQPLTTSESQSLTTSESQPQSSSAPQSTASVNDISYSDGTNLFQAISTDDVPQVFSRQDLAITLQSPPSDGKPIHTNKFYTNLILDDQTMPAYVQPYTVWWSKLESFPGLGISHTTDSQKVYGPDASVTPVEYYINPVGLISFAFSASEFTADNMGLSLLNSETFSTNVQISSAAGSIQFPLVQGMGFVTAKYDGNLTPLITSQLGIKTLVQSTNGPSHVKKYVAQLFNEVSWVIYVTVPDGDDFSLSVNEETGEIVGSSKSKVTIQVAVLPDNTESDYDKAAGLYPTAAHLSGFVSGTNSAFYNINYDTEGTSVSGNTIIHALPHHRESLTDSTAGKSTNIQLDTTTKGVAYGYLTTSLEFYYALNQKIQFLPTTSSDSITLSADALKLIADAANKDLADDFTAQTNLDSTYFAGKGFDKLAYILLVVNDILGDAEVSKETLDRLKSVFSLFTSNKQINPLMYDTLLKGITSTAAQGGDTSTDFGSPYYNDHHFHYGYFIHAAAVIGYVDTQQGGTWVAENKDWINSLVRDVANPSSDDGYFPVFRSFDWYNGHSWAKGLYASSDGKDEESTSEDYNFAYGMKLWGKIIKDGSMEARGDLMLAVLAKSLDNYFYFKDDNKVQPAQFIGNRVPGITFENKLDYTTYFGTNKEYIHGIHMIPLTPVSSAMRTPEFVQQEWDSKNLSDLADSLSSGWRGIFKSNQAIFDPVSSYDFFAQDDFSSDWIDGGASRTWYLAYTAALGGSTN